MQIDKPGSPMSYGLLLFVCIGLAVSAIGAKDGLTWFLEVVWVFAGIPLVIWRWKKFPLTKLLSCLLVFRALVLMYGDHYTYAEKPLGLGAKETFEFSRTHYARFDHFL